MAGLHVCYYQKESEQCRKLKTQNAGSCSCNRLSDRFTVNLVFWGDGRFELDCWHRFGIEITTSSILHSVEPRRSEIVKKRRRCKPVQIVQVLEVLVEVKNMPTEELSEIYFQNSLNVCSQIYHNF